MGRQEKTLASKWTKTSRKHIKSLGKSNDVRMIGGIAYKSINDFFFHSIVQVGYINNQFTLYGAIDVKPYSLDDLFWDVFDATENKDAPLSLRANGAYVAPSIQIDMIKLEVSSEEELQEICSNYLDEFDNVINRFLEKVDNVESFYSLYKDEIEARPNKLLLILIDIHQGRYGKALALIDSELQLGKSGGFCAESKSIFEYAKEYCEERI